MSLDTVTRLNQVYEAIEKRIFAPRIHAGAEVEFYIFDYPPQDEIDVREHTASIMQKLKSDYPGKEIVEINLYHLLLDYLKSRKLLDQSIKLQKKDGDKAILKALAGPLSESKVAGYLVDQIKPESKDLVVLTGIGSAWPLLKSHTLLSNLHGAFHGTPLLVFYPGEYDGKSLTLFGKIKNKNYYRAFRLVGEEVL